MPRGTRVDARRLEAALCALADHESLVKEALADSGLQPNGLHDVCHALRRIVDDGFRSRETPGGS